MRTRIKFSRQAATLTTIKRIKLKFMYEETYVTDISLSFLIYSIHYFKKKEMRITNIKYIA